MSGAPAAPTASAPPQGAAAQRRPQDFGSAPPTPSPTTSPRVSPRISPRQPQHPSPLSHQMPLPKPQALPLLASHTAKVHVVQASLPSTASMSTVDSSSTLSHSGDLSADLPHDSHPFGHAHHPSRPRSRSVSSTQPSPVSTTNNHHHHHNNVLSRLSLLFHHEHQSTAASSSASPPIAFPGADDDLPLDFDDDPSPTPPPKDRAPDRARPPPPDRDAIKVLVVTWNMGDALPKGDLSVLLGDVPAYEPTARDAVAGLPRLPVENVHPYHVVVFAAQECPTPSGVPRGLGGGLMKGVGLQKPDTLFRRDKDAPPSIKEPSANGKPDKEPSGDERDKPPTADKDKPGQAKDKPPAKDKSPAPPTNHTHKPVVAAVKDVKDKIAQPVKDVKDKIAHPVKDKLSFDKLATAKDAKPTKDKDLPGSPFEIPAGTSTPRKPHLDRLGLDTLGLSTPPRYAAMSPTEEKLSPWADDGERHHHLHGPALRPPAGLAPGPKGWSAMLEEWLCCGPAGPAPRNNSAQLSPLTTTKPLQVITTAPTTGTPTAGTPSANFLDKPTVITTSPIEMSADDAPAPWSAGGALAPPTPAKTSTAPSTPAKPIGIPGSAPSASLAAPSPSYNRPLSGYSDFAGSVSTTFGTSFATSTFGSTPASVGVLLAPPTPTDRPERDMNRSPSQRSDRSERGDTTPACRREPGNGPYVNVAKERLLGLYLSVFVYRGCEHLVRGVDKDYVTAGLAGGRFGNKGGIGISLNLNGHRLLFVNAHLAAHAERNDARIANIAKIKSELNLNCFLPADDPRSMFEDITDRFDTTFWCGDLNFRVDISLLHARWLLEQKKYQDALMFDQLKKAMEDPKTNPFPGFEEAPITFMPTFKYDVWKSVRATNRDIRRSLRKRRNTMDRHDRPGVEGGQPAAGLEFVPEGDGPEESGSDTREHKAKLSGCDDDCADKCEDKCGDVFGVAARSARSGASTDEHHEHVNLNLDDDLAPPPPLKDLPGFSVRHPDSPLHDGASARSSLYAPDISFAPSFTASDVADPRMSGEYSFRRNSLLATSPLTTTNGSFSFNDSFGSGSLASPSPSGTAPPKRGLKERTKKLLGILSLARRPSATRPPPPTRLGPAADDVSSRRLSIGSFRSTVLSEDGRSHVSNMSSDGGALSPCLDDIPDKERGDNERERDRDRGDRERDKERSHSGGSQHLGHARRSSNASQKLLASPPRRHLSILRRTPSGRSAPPAEEEYSFDLDGFDDTKDHRVGRYDTSKKQRIPSWCDRVLYKTHIIPDEEVIDDDESSRFEATGGRFHRISNAFATLGDHFRRRGSIAFEPSSFDRENSLGAMPSTPPARLDADTSGTEQLRESTASSALGLGTSLPSASASISTKELGGADDQASSILPRSLGSRSITFEGLPATPRTARYGDLASSPEKPSSLSSPSKAMPKPRRASSTESTPSRRASNPHLRSRRGSVSSARRGSVSGGTGTVPRRRLTDGGGGGGAFSAGVAGMAGITHVKSTGHSVMLNTGAEREKEGVVGTMRRRMSGSGGEPPQLNMIARFLRDLPGRFHSRVSLFHGSDADGDGEAEGPRRRLAGEVEVLHYGTIDDAGMRQLEGRSDHRPAIFSAAIYV